MTNSKDDKLNILSAADRSALEKLSGDIAEAEKRLDLMEELGFGVGELKAKLAWSKQRTAILLKKG